jgi:hypothetical protein
MENRLLTFTIGALTAGTMLWSSIAPAQAQDAAKILKAMTDYVASQKVISATYDSDIEVITNNLQKLQFASSGQLLLSRPDKARVSRIVATLTPNLSLTARHSACSARISMRTRRQMLLVRSINLWLG